LTPDPLFYTFSAMENVRTIWNHEVRQADRIAKILLDGKKVALNWKILLLPVFLYGVYHFRKNLRFTRKNLLFTKKLAFEASKNIFRGRERAWEIRGIEIKTNEILSRDRQGVYTEEIQRRQLSEIELLIDHYLQLLRSERSSYAQVLKSAYPAKGKYLNYLSRLHRAEAEIIQTSIDSIRRGTKKERREWFQKIKETTKKIRMTEADEIYSES
jgi:hypothetical protein